jgi:hypothetical protein
VGDVYLPAWVLEGKEQIPLWVAGMSDHTEELLARLDREHSLRMVSLSKPPKTTIWGEAAAEIRRLAAEVKSLRA